MFYHRYRKILLPLSVFPIIILLWITSIYLFQIPDYLLPHPWELVKEIVALFRKANLASHISVTLKEIFSGTALGIILGMFLGYLLAHCPIAERLVMPLVILIQTAPKISLAPLFILWMGLGIESKIALVVLVVSFPVMINQIAALRNIDDNTKNLLSVLGASKFQILRYVELPCSLEMLLSGIKVAVTQAMIGAVIGEMMGAKAGLGYLLTLGNETYDIKMILASVLLLSLIGLVLYLLSEHIEQRLLYWKELETDSCQNSY